MNDVPEDVARLLPAGYLAALEAFAGGESDEEVAERIGVHPAAARAAVRLATAKLLAATSEAARSSD